MFEGTRIGVIAVVSDMTVDLRQEVDPRVYSVFQPSEVYFPPYNKEEIRGILSERVQQGFYPGVLSDEMLDLVVEKTMETGDLRVGIDLLKRAGLNAEINAHMQIEREDIQEAHKLACYVHLCASIRALRKEEKDILRRLAELNTITTEISMKKGFNAVRETMKIGYSSFYRSISKFDSMRLVNINFLHGKGGTRMITLRYEPERVIEACG